MPFSADPFNPTDPQSGRPTTAVRRRVWVMEALKDGQSHPEIAEALGITRERVRQIAREALEGHRVEPAREHIHVQIARLVPALQLASEAIERGEVSAIAPMLKVLDRLDAYQARALTFDMPDRNAETAAKHRAFMEKMERIKKDFRDIGLGGQVRTLAEAYAAAQVTVESLNADAAPPTAPDAPPLDGEDDEDLEVKENEKPNLEA